MLRQPALLSLLAIVAALAAPAALAQGDSKESAKEQPWRLGKALGVPDWLRIGGAVRPRYETLSNTLVAGRSGGDEFLETQLQPERMRAACDAANHPLDLRIRPGYDHSYYFIASFIGEHFRHHMRRLNLAR